MSGCLRRAGSLRSADLRMHAGAAVELHRLDGTPKVELFVGFWGVFYSVLFDDGCGLASGKRDVCGISYRSRRYFLTAAASFKSKFED